MKERTKQIIGLIIAVALFIIASYFIQTNLELVKSYLDQGVLSMLVYVAILFLATVLAPITVIPLFPIAASLWGVWVTFGLTLISWFAGAMVAFYLARKYGIPLVKRFFSLNEIEKYQKHIPQENILIGLIFFRIALPFDIFNYLLGLFKHIKTWTFFISTLISYIIYALAFSFVGSLPWQWQLISFAISLGIILISWFVYKGRKNTREAKYQKGKSGKNKSQKQ